MKTLEQLRVMFEDITAEWDGNESGIKEDRADIAQDALDAIKVIEEKIKELN